MGILNLKPRSPGFHIFNQAEKLSKVSNVSAQRQSSKKWSVLELFAQTMWQGGEGVTELTASEGLNYKFNSKIRR